MKKLGIGAGILVVLVGVGLVVGRQVLLGYLTPEYLVGQMEEQWNCRAEIKSIKVSLFGTATVDLKGFALSSRDSSVEEKTPLKERSALENPAIFAESVLLEVRLQSLLRQRLDIRELTVSGLKIDTVVSESGESSIRQLFESPGEAQAVVAAAAPGPPPLAPPPLPSGPVTPETEKGKVTEVVNTAPVSSEPENESESKAEGLPVATVADRMAIENGSMTALIEKTGARFFLENASMAFTQIDVDPAHLDSRNRAEFQFGADVILKPAIAEGEGDFLRMHVSGSGEMRPFDPVSGKVDPVWSSDVTLHSGATVETFPLVEKIHEMLKKAETAGIDFGEFTLTGKLTADAQTRIAHQQGKYVLEKPLLIQLPETDMNITEGSWVHSGTNQHALEATIVASEELTQRIDAMVEKYLMEKAGSLGAGLKGTVMALILDEGRVSIDVASSGDLGKPKADIVTPLGNLTDVLDQGKKLKDSFKKAGEELLKGLFGK